MTRGEVQRNLYGSLDNTFGAHLQALCARTAHALELGGYSGLLVYAGSPLPVFEDDRTYPFEANAPFKVWVPLADAPGSFIWFTPGSAPRLIIERPQDYWHKPTDLPQGYWVRHFDVHAVPDRAAARGLLPRDLSGAAYIGDSFEGLGEFGLGALNPRPLMGRLDYGRAAKTPHSTPARRSSRSSLRFSPPADCASRSFPTTPSSHSTRRVQCSITRYWRNSCRASGTRC